MFALFQGNNLVALTFDPEDYDPDLHRVEIDRAPEEWETVTRAGKIIKDVKSFKKQQENRVNRRGPIPTFKDLEDAQLLIEVTLYDATGHTGPLLEHEMQISGLTAEQVRDVVHAEARVLSFGKERRSAVHAVRKAPKPLDVQAASMTRPKL